MSTKKFLVAWHIFAFTYLVFFISLMGILPELKTFSYLTNKYGFIDIEEWDFCYLVFIALLTLLINNIIIITVFKFFKKFK